MDKATKKVLVVDDDVDIRSLVTGLVQLCDGEAVEIGGGANVLDVAIQEMPDLVVLDVMMPDCSGFEALQVLRFDARTGHIPVIMLTAVNDFELGRRHTTESIGMELGVRPPEAFLEKPIDTKALLEKMKALLEI